VREDIGPLHRSDAQLMEMGHAPVGDALSKLRLDDPNLAAIKKLQSSGSPLVIDSILY
jgi:hypothetical protein